MQTSRRILCVVDGPNWVFNRHVQALKRFLGDEFEFETTFRGQAYDENAFDLIYPLEFNMVEAHQIHNPAKYVTGIRSFVSWADWDFLELVNYLNNHFQAVHAVTRELFELFQLYLPGLWYVTHGVDIAIFSPRQPIRSPAGRLRLGWAGNRKTIVKGFRDFIQPLGMIPGVELVFCGFADRNLSLEEMPTFYDSIDAYICASSFEGNNNTLLEAAAMGRAIITTPTGSVPEYLENEVSALIIERKLEQFEAAAIRLRDDPDLRLRLGNAARQAILINGWDWLSKSEEYQRFLRQSLQNAANPWAPPEWVEPFNYQHYAHVLEVQYRLERELRIGYAYEGIELRYQLDELTQVNQSALKAIAESESLSAELEAIKESETYKLANWLKNSPLGQAFIQLYKRFKP